MAVDAQCLARASTASATWRTRTPSPPNSAGTRTDSNWAERRASIASTGKRALRSTSSAAGPATSSPIRAASRRSRAAVLDVTTSLGGCADEGGEGGADGGDRLERPLAQHALGEFDVERVLQGQHHAD